MSLCLIGLPRELRDRILELVIQSHTIPPENASDPEKRTELRDIELDGGQGAPSVMHVRSLNRADFIPTLLVNRQLHAETMEVIRLLPVIYIMHAMLVNECQLWPTWVSVPVLSPRIERLHFSVVSVGPRTGGRSGWQFGTGGPPPITWFFYSLLERVLKVGPRLGHRHKEPTSISIKILDIEVLSPDVPAEQLSPENEYPDPYADNQAVPNLVIHPKKFKSFLCNLLDYLLQMNQYNASYGAILYERIGIIRIIVDGKVSDEFDLGTRLQQCQFSDSRQRGRLPYLNKWKVDTYETRIRLGFSVAPNDSDGTTL